MYALDVYAHPDSESWDEVNAAVRTANGLQTHFKCTLNALSKPLSAKKTQIDFAVLEKALAAAKPPVTGLVFCEERFQNSLLIYEVLPKRIYVSCRVSRE